MEEIFFEWFWLAYGSSFFGVLGGYGLISLGITLGNKLEIKYQSYLEKINAEEESEAYAENRDSPSIKFIDYKVSNLISDYNLALEKFEIGEYKKSLKLMNRALKSDCFKNISKFISDSKKAQYCIYAIRGLSHFCTNNFVKASKDIDKALIINEGDAFSKIYFSKEFLINARGSSKMGMSKFKEALDDFKISLNLLTSNGEKYLKFKSQKNQTIEVNDNYDLFALTNANLGEAYYFLGNYKTAIKYFDEAIKRVSIDYEYFKQRGSVKNDLGKYLDAIEDFDKAIQLNPDDSHCHELKDLAIKNFENEENSISINSETYADDLYNRGISRLELEKFTEAIQDFNKFIEINPQNCNALKYRSIAYIELKNLNAAISDLDKIIQINPHDYVSLRYRGLSKYNLGKYLDAIEDFDRAIQINPYDSKSISLKEKAYSMSKYQKVEEPHQEIKPKSSKSSIFKILILEGDKGIQKIYKNYFNKRVQHQIIYVSNGLEALTKIKDNKVDILITNTLAPGLDGISLTKEVRKFNNTIPIIWISSLNSKSLELKEILENLEISKVFIKPFALEDLKKFVNNKISDFK